MTRRPNPARCDHVRNAWPNPARCEHLCRRFGTWDPDRYPSVQTRRCIDCGAWLPLGPANDAPPEVQQEIRAAEISADGPSSTLYECLGWADRNAHDRGEPYPGARKPIRIQRNAQWHAGYLARAIVEHGDP